MVSLVPLAACFAAAVPALLRVEDHPDGPPVDVLTSAGRALLLAAVAAGAIVTIGAFLEERRPVRAEAEARAHRVLGALGLAVVLAALVAGAAWVGNPSQRADDAWASFKQGYGENRGGNRLTSGLGSNRYDFYRVALDVFAAHPIAGAGADNFQQEYLARGRSEETPRYPHSVELGALSETGAIGAALLLTALVAGVAAGLRGTRARDPLARAAAVGALGAFAYWLVHGSADWFFEIAGLGAPAFAWLGLAAALAPRPEEEHDPPRWPLLYGRPGAWPAALAAALAVVVLLAPWLAGQDQVRAAQAWRTDPAGAYARLDRARALDPLSDGPDLLAGSIAVRSGDLRRADAAFARALARNPRGSYATLQRGAIASQLGRRAAAVTLLARAAALAPRDRLTRYALSIARGRGRVDVARLNEAILAEARGLAG
jgi:tetratricopeptide (TPR) repeat protein